MKHDYRNDQSVGRDYPTAIDADASQGDAGEDTRGRRLRPGSGFLIAALAGGISLILAVLSYVAGLGLGWAIVLYLVGSPVLAFGIGWFFLEPKGAAGTSTKQAQSHRCLSL